VTLPPGPFHEGERAVQRQAGVSREAEAVGRILSPSITPAIARALSTMRMAVATSLDAAGRPWASLLTGGAGFMQAVDDRLLRLDVRPDPLDPLSANLRDRPELGLLAIDPRTRQRIRVNGLGGLLPSGARAPEAIFLMADTAYGNCPKHIVRRHIVGEAQAGTGTSTRTAALDARQQSWIAAADTFFIASFDAEGGADASHRGGRAGFVRVLDERHLEFDDYDGNNMFNTLGNLVREPRAGLLFLDFAGGDVLHLTGRTGLRFAPARSVVFEIEEGVYRPGASTLRWSPGFENKEEP
jgi:predicted pyridoxine 5'-phosphate oxidase superfamily flavin-nucleotide-binding protein